MRRTNSLAGVVAVLLAFGVLLIAPQNSGVAAAASAHVTVMPSAGPAFIPPNCGTGAPAYNY